MVRFIVIRIFASAAAAALLGYSRGGSQHRTRHRAYSDSGPTDRMRWSTSIERARDQLERCPCRIPRGHRVIRNPDSPANGCDEDSIGTETIDGDCIDGACRDAVPAGRNRKRPRIFLCPHSLT